MNEFKRNSYIYSLSEKRGSALRITTEVLNNSKIEISPKEILAKFEKVICYFQESQNRIDYVTKLCDILLPKLMNGDLEVSKYLI